MEKKKMNKKERPLPSPQSTPFGRKRHPEEGDGNTPLTADRMAEAMAGGKLEEFLREEMPDNEYARKLAGMMMGMTGMLPPDALSSAPGKEPKESPDFSDIAHAPEDVLKAAESGDVKDLMMLLEREHRKRTPGGDAALSEKTEADESASPAAAEKEVIDRIMKISSENGLPVDWVIMRALKLYIEEFEKSGRL